MNIPEMPACWSMGNPIVSLHELLGELAGCAVRQSPYLCPGNLPTALQEFQDAWGAGAGPEDYTPVPAGDLIRLVRSVFESCPTILAWNNSKKGNVQLAAYSRYGTPPPDYDFIDLDALARNIAHAIILDNHVSAAQDAASKGFTNSEED